MATNAADSIIRVRARLAAFRQNLPDDRFLQVEWVRAYHVMLDELEGLGLSLGEFRVPPEHIRTTRLQTRAATMDGPARYARDPLVQIERGHLLTRLDAFLSIPPAHWIGDTTMTAPTDISELDARRFLFLSAVYDESGGVAERMLKWTPIFERVRLPMKENWEPVMMYLTRDGFVKHGGGGWVSITHKGVKEVEAARRKPAEPTPGANFPPGIQAHIASLTVGAGAVVQFGFGNTANVQNIALELGDEKRDAIARLLADLLTAAQAAQATDAVEEIREAQARVENRSMSPARVVAGLVTVSSLVQGVASVQGAVQAFKIGLAAIGISIP